MGFESFECKKVKTEDVFISDITLEENILIESVNNKIIKSKDKVQSEKSFQCDKCDKNYKFASGLHYHNKYGHKNDKN